MNERELEGLVIEISSRCNYRCVGCPNPVLPRGHGDMDSQLFLDIFKEAGNNIYKAFLWNYGDPLLNRRLPEMLESIRHYKCLKVLSTNGCKLEDFSDLSFFTTLDKLIISINGLTQEVYEIHQKNGNLERVIRGVKKLVPILEGTKTRLIMQMVAHKENLHQVEQTELVGKFAREIGFHEVIIKSFNVMDMKQETFNRFVPINTSYSRYQKNFRTIRPYNSQGRYPCTEGMVINWDGSVNPCCWDYKGKHILGNLKNKGIYEIWNSPKAVEHREKITSGKFLDICIIDCTSRDPVKQWHIK